MRVAYLMCLPFAALLALPAVASEPDKSAGERPTSERPASQRPVGQKDVSAVDVVATPAGDLNLRKDEIPALLLAAQEQPYALGGLGNCRRLTAEIGRLDAVLGDDIDMPQAEGRRTSPGRVAQSVVGAFIPFRGVIREISGANSHDRKLQTAILAGVARRSFLKGTGQAKGCRYPARAAAVTTAASVR